MSTRQIGVMVGAAVVLVGIAAVFLRPGRGDSVDPARAGAQSAADSGATPGANGSLGIRVAAVDSAVRAGGAAASVEPDQPVVVGAGARTDESRSDKTDAEGERAVADGMRVVSSESSPPPRVVQAPTVVPSAAAIAESNEVQAAQPGAKAAVDAWLASRRVKIRASCWDGDELPESVSFFAEVTYGAEGSLLALSLSDSGAPSAVRGCVSAVRDLVPPTIEAPGIPVTVRGTLTLP